MHGADLSRGELENAELQYADLQLVDITETNLTKTNFMFANLKGARCDYARLYGSYMIYFSEKRTSNMTNWIYTYPGWNYAVRLYQPEDVILNKQWEFPPLTYLGEHSSAHRFLPNTFYFFFFIFYYDL